MDKKSTEQLTAALRLAIGDDLYNGSVDFGASERAIGTLER